MKFFVLTLFIFLVNLSQIYNHRPCGAGLLKQRREFVHPPDEEGRYLSEDKWEPIRIHLDYSFIENNIGKFRKEDLIDLKEKIMPKTKKVFESLLKVRRLKSKLRLNTTMCDNFNIPEIYQQDGEGVDADLVIFVMIDDTGFFLENRIEAAAVHCLQHSETRRPIAGYIQFKPELEIQNSTGVDYMAWLALHECSHILVFNDGLYQDYVDNDYNPIGAENVIGKQMYNGKQISMIKSPNVLQVAREHFGCPDLEGVPLEYNGGPGTAGAHWSKKFMNTDYMIGDSYGENLVTHITLALFKDSGWYNVEYSNSNYFLWGKNKGCSFFQSGKKCIDKDPNDSNKFTTSFKPDFCTTPNKEVCSISNIFRGRCTVKRFMRELPSADQLFPDTHTGGIDTLTDHCPIAIEEKRDQAYYGGSCRVGDRSDISDYEVIGPDSACFMSTLEYKDDFKRINDNKKTKAVQNKISLPGIRISEISELPRFKSVSRKMENKMKQVVNTIKNDANIVEVITTNIDKNQGSNSNLRSKSKSEVKIKNEDKSEFKTKTEVKPELKINSKIEVQPEARTNIKTEVIPGSKISSKTTIESKPASKSESKSEIKIEEKKMILKSKNKLRSPDEPKAACLRFECNQNGQIKIDIYGEMILCKEDGEPTIIEGFNGSIICPPSEVLCANNWKCKFGCTDRYGADAQKKEDLEYSEESSRRGKTTVKADTRRSLNNLKVEK